MNWCSPPAMKKLFSEEFMMKKPTLVLMAGLPGVGKSTLAGKLGETLHWPVIDKDTIKDKILQDGSHSNDNDAATSAYNTSFLLIQKHLIYNHQSIILDSSMLHQSIFEQTVQLAQEADAHLKIVLCFCDEELRQKRMHARVTRPSQKYCQLVPKESFLYIEKYIATVDTKPLKICTNTSQYKYIDIVKAYVLDNDIDTCTRAPSDLKQHIKDSISFLEYNISRCCFSLTLNACGPAIQ